MPWLHLQIRAKLMGCLDKPGPGTMHAVCMSLEHERMHQETLCYMVAQQRKQDYRLQHILRRHPGSGDRASAPPTPIIQLAAVPSTLQPFYLQGCSYPPPSRARRQCGSSRAPVYKGPVWLRPGL